MVSVDTAVGMEVDILAVMSFHYAEIPFTPEMFPYKKKGGANS